jgi:hypothetical protein
MISVMNTLECCNGFYARILNNQRSAIDHILMSNEVTKTKHRKLIKKKII